MADTGRTATKGSGDGAARHGRVVRLTSYSVASVLALLLTTAAFPPLLSDQSDRAVVNAPVSLLTAPIAGEVPEVRVKVGDRLDPGQEVARIHNGRLDRSTLIVLEGKVDELRGSLEASKRKRVSDEEYVAALDREIRLQTDQMAARLAGEISEARAKVSAAEAEGLSTKAVVDRQQSMVDRNTASIDLLRPTQHKLEAARFERDAAKAKLDQKAAQLDAVRKGIFVGNEFNGLAVLAQKRRDLSFDAQRLAIEEVQFAAALKGQQALLDAERARLDRLTDARLSTGPGGHVLGVSVAPGRHVSPGDSVATMVDCGQAFVVAIFSYRQAQDLAVGTPVRISSAAGDVPTRGTVAEILPKTSDRTDQQYAVPFPQTERREMYVLVSLDGQAAGGMAGGKASPCSVGRWVTVTRDGGWLPSASVTWKAVAEGLSGPNARAAWETVSTGATRAVANVRGLAGSVFDRPPPASAIGARADNEVRR